VLGIASTTVPTAAIMPGMGIPTPRPLPTLPPTATFPTPQPTAPPISVTPAPRATASSGKSSQPTTGAAASSPTPAGTPSAFAQTNTFVYGSPPPSNFGGPGDAPQIFYATLTPTVFTPNSTVRVNVITTTNVQRVAIGTLSSTITLSAVAPGQWQGVFSANVLGLPPAANSLALNLVAQRRAGQSASIATNVNSLRKPKNEETH